jgi:hypothetical protein
MMLEKTQAKNSTSYQDVAAGGYGHYEPLPAYSGGVFSIWVTDKVESLWKRVKHYMVWTGSLCMPPVGPVVGRVNDVVPIV